MRLQLTALLVSVRTSLYLCHTQKHLGSRTITSMIETKHLTKGSTVPPLSKGTLRIYNMRFCPFAQRVLLVLDTKKVPYEVVNVDLTVKPEWLVEKSPLGKVPALELDGEILYESLIVSDYLDEKYPQVPLYPKDPMRKAKDKLVIERFSQVISYMLGMLMNPDKMNLEYLEKTLSALDVFETELTARKTQFFGGDRPNMVDLMIWPWCERADLLRIIGGEDYKLPVERFTKLMSWAKAMKDDEGVKVSYLKPEIHAKYMASRATGHADYDMLVKSNL